MSKIFVAGHNGMVGSAICRALEPSVDLTIVTASRDELDLTNQADVEAYMRQHQFDHVYIAAAKVGGILANQTYPADFLYDNLMIQANLLRSCLHSNVERVLFLGSSCIYPKYAQQPMNEEQLLSGALEATNEAYAVAKIAGIKLCESYRRQHGVDYRAVMPTNLYGPNDSFHPENSHVIPGLMRRIHEAKVAGLSSVKVWGTGQPRREFLHVDDMASACVFVMNLQRSTYDSLAPLDSCFINVGVGADFTIREIAESLCEVIGFKGALEFDTTKPDGTPRKLLDVKRIRAAGWSSRIALQDGLASTYAWYTQHIETANLR